jgi:predicted methyltransferase
MHMLVFSEWFSRRITDWSVYDTFVMTPDTTINGALLDLSRGDYKTTDRK